MLTKRITLLCFVDVQTVVAKHRLLLLHFRGFPIENNSLISSRHAGTPALCPHWPCPLQASANHQQHGWESHTFWAGAPGLSESQTRWDTCAQSIFTFIYSNLNACSAFNMYVACWHSPLKTPITKKKPHYKLQRLFLLSVCRMSSRFIFWAEVLSGSSSLQVAGLQLGLSQPRDSKLCLEHMNSATCWLWCRGLAD